MLGFAGGGTGLGSAGAPSLAAGRLWTQPRADKCIELGAIYVCGHHEGDDV